ncbi:CMP-N-acetylneuraminate-beta-galactosamide-alpha-2,3-sialyltransferase 1-like [Notolabrus celidotus]|uniref:CMP-N-acetylneuraminate-beta-galactosamide- alpha-2,3-sialyltransferase 1-like n=1 Tax=Notolabrus celidotus TaxID=1203425 RepID=UPI00148F9118|nr:CMP-N-acetylneuraminate-beta-galactosamide-alpha-2,3-sialyltransferase 1-like [Notolabrus celidotus]
MNPKVKVLLFLLCLTGIFVFMREYVKQPPLLPDDCTCVCEKGDSGLMSGPDQGWFATRFNKNMQPFLSANYSLPEEAFNWWKFLQYEKRSYKVYEATMKGLLEMFPSTPNLPKPSPNHNHYRTCAVMGNSGNLRGSRYGPLIDANEVILRMNTGRVEGYEADVGHRTTHRIMYPESALDLEDNTHLVLFPFKIQDLEWLVKALSTGFSGTSYMPVKSKIKANKDLVMVINPAFMKYVHETWLGKKGRYPSTGFIALLMALHICDEVNVFGFGADKDGNWSHYWEALTNKRLKTGVHPGTQEYDIILALAKQLKIKFYRGW